MAEPTRAQKAVVHRTGSTNSCGAIIQSSPAKNLRRKSSHLPPIQTKTGLYKSKSVPSVVKSLTFTDDSQDLSEYWPCEVPRSAPPVITPEPVFVWSSPKTPPQGAAFYEWSNGTPTISPSSSNHQDSIRMASEDKQRRSEKAANPYNDTFRVQTSADGVTTTEGQTKWSRKPPHHLPPLDPSIFKTKSKSVKAVASSRGKKTKRCVNRPTEMESSNKMSSEKHSKSTNRTEDGFRIHPENDQLSDKQTSVTSHSIKQNSRPPCMYHSVNGGDDVCPCHGTLQNAQNIVPSKCEPKALRRSTSLSYSMELLSSNETGVDGRAGTSKGFSIQKSRALEPSYLPLIPEATSNGKRSNGISIRRKAVVIAPNRPTYECDRAANSRTRRGESLNVPSFRATPAIPTEFQNAARIATEESHVVGEFPRFHSQPGPSSLNSGAYWEVRKVGVCRQVQSATEEKNRRQVRVLLKKFGTLDIKKN